MKGNFCFSLLSSLLLAMSCKPNHQANIPYAITSSQSFAIISMQLSNVYGSEQYHQMPDHSLDCITSYETYNFLHKKDSGNLVIEIPLEMGESCLSMQDDDDYLYRIERMVRSNHLSAKTFNRKIFSVDSFKLYGFTFDDGFELHGCIDRGTFVITLTGITDTIMREQIMQSIKIRPLGGVRD